MNPHYMTTLLPVIFAIVSQQGTFLLFAVPRLGFTFRLDLQETVCKPSLIYK